MDSFIKRGKQTQREYGFEYSIRRFSASNEISREEILNSCMKRSRCMQVKQWPEYKTHTKLQMLIFIYSLSYYIELRKVKHWLPFVHLLASVHG
jgi:hypothetical protein